jgi:hypothetical protein
VRIF